MSGRTIDRFEVTGDLGETGFGTVLQGRDPNGGQDVRIQLCTVDDPELRRRFYAEAAGVAKLRHPHVVEVRGVGFEGEVPFLAEEFLPRSLDQILEQRPPWSAGEKLALLQQVGKGLAYGHARGLQHLELRPDQVRLANVDGRHVAKVGGFGIARLVSTENRLARSGVTLETAVYLPPEQIRGGSVDHRVDLFAFGVVAYELLTYERPFRGQNLSALVYQILYKDPQPMTAAWTDCPASLEAIISRCLSKKAEDRTATVEAVLGEIDGFLRQAHGRWAALEKPYQAIPSVTRDVSDTEVTRSQLARTARDLGAKGSGGAATVRIPMEPAERVSPVGQIEATQALPALGEEIPSSATAGTSVAGEKPGETTVSLPSPPEAIPPEEETASSGAPAAEATPPPPPPGTKREGVDTRPVGRQTVRLDAIPVVTPNRPVTPAPSPPDELPTVISTTPLSDLASDEMPTVTSVKPEGGLAPDEMPTVVSADELAAIVAATAAAPGPPAADPSAQKPPASPPPDELPTVVGTDVGDELPTVLSTQPLAALAIKPTDTSTDPVASPPVAELPVEDLSSDDLASETVTPQTVTSEDVEEPTLVGAASELPTALGLGSGAASALTHVAPPEEDGDEPTLVTASSELPTTVLPSSDAPEEPTLVTTSSELPTTVLPSSEDEEEPTLVSASELPTALMSTPPPAPPEATAEAVSDGLSEATFVAPLGGVASPPDAPAAAESVPPAAPSTLDQAAFAPPTSTPTPVSSAPDPAAPIPSPGFEAPPTPSGTPLPSMLSPTAAPTPTPPVPPVATPTGSVPASATPSSGVPAGWGGAPSSPASFASGSPGAPTAPPSASPASDPGSVVLSQAPAGPAAPSKSEAGRSGLAKGLLIGLGVVALLGMLAVAGGIWWWMSRADRQQTPESQVVTAPPRPAPPVAADTPRGHVTVLASPWGRVIEVTDGAGFVQHLPDDPHTPMLLELVPGRYRITVQYGDDPSALGSGMDSGLDAGVDADASEASTAGSVAADEAIARGEPLVCEVEVRLDTVARCQVAFEAPSANDYFKEVGWWQ